MLVITLAALTVPTASRITVVCLPAVNVNGISAADLIVGQLSVSAARESVLGRRVNGNDSGTISSAGIESVLSGICECYRRIIRERTTSRRARMA